MKKIMKWLLILLFPTFLMSKSFILQKWYLSPQHLPQDIGIETIPYISIHKENKEHQISGFDGCNYFVAKLKKVDSHFIINSNIGGTLMACENEAMNSLSTWLISFLTKAKIKIKEENFHSTVLAETDDIKVYFFDKDPNSPD